MPPFKATGDSVLLGGRLEGLMEDEVGRSLELGMATVVDSIVSVVVVVVVVVVGISSSVLVIKIVFNSISSTATI